MITLLGWARVALIDLRGDLRRFTILLACLALGVGAIAAVSSVGAALQGAIARDARVFLGGDLEARLSYRAANAEELAFFASLGAVSEVIELNARAVAGENAAFLSVRAVDEAYPLAGTVEIEGVSSLSAALSPEGGSPGAIVDPLVIERLGIELGDRFSIGTAEFTARAILRALPDEAAQGFQLGAPVLVAADALGATGLVQPGLIARYRYKIALRSVTFEEASRAIVERFPDAGWTVRSPEQAASTLSRFFDLFSRFLILVGLSSLLVGGVGVSNAASAYIAERQRSIATMRALGATGARILVHFLIQIMILAAAGTIIGVVLGAASTLIALPILGDLLALQLQPGIDPASLLNAAAFGLLIAFAFAFVPLTRAARLRPASLFQAASGAVVEGALRWWELFRPKTLVPLLLGVGGIAGLAVVVTRQPTLVMWYGVGALVAFAMLRLAALALQWFLRLLPPAPNATLRAALAAIHRPGAPAPTVVLSLGLGLSLLLLIAQIDGNLRGQLEGEIAREAPSFIMFDLQPDMVSELQQLTETDERILSFEETAILRGTITRVKDVPASELGELPPDIEWMFRGDIGLTWARELPAESQVVEGSWWTPDYAGTPLVSLDIDMKEPLGLSIGDTIELSILGRPFLAEIASFRQIDVRGPAFAFSVVLSPGLIESAPASFTATMKTVPEAEAAVSGELARGYPTLQFLPVSDALNRLAEVLGSVANAVAVVGGFAVLSGMLVLAGALAAGRKQREADAVVMKVIGATRGDVIRAFLVEYGLLGALATLIASLLGSVAAWAIITHFLELPFTLDLRLLTLVLLGAVTATILTGLLTTWSALSVRPAHFLRNA